MSASVEDVIARFVDGEKRIAKATDGLDVESMKVAPPADRPELGKWTIHQIIIHLGDAELAIADRIKRVIAMDEPALLAWDEIKFSQRLHYDQQSAATAISVIRLVRGQVSSVLKCCQAGDFERTGMHDERGPQSLKQIVEFADWHLDHHLSFVGKKRIFFKK